MPATILVRHRPGSRGGRALREALGPLARRSSTITNVPRQYRTVINWGNSAPLAGGRRAVILNKPEVIPNATDKLTAFAMMQAQGVRVPKFVTELTTVEGIWLARTIITGHSGEGIVVLRQGDAIVDAPLYTQYIPKRQEFRLHVVGKRVIFVQEKRRERGAEQTRDERLIRSHANAWIYCEQNVEYTEEMGDQAVNAVQALGLDFGAVDVVLHKETQQPYVLEVNTAPGLESTALKQAYVEAFTTA